MGPCCGINIGLNLVLVPYFGIIAAALTTLLGYGFILAVTAIYSVRHMTLDVDFGFILKSIFASIVISLFVLVWHASGLLSISALIVICAVVYTAICLSSKDLRQARYDSSAVFSRDSDSVCV